MDSFQVARRSIWLDIARWILFAIVGFFLPGIAQLFTGTPALHDNAWATLVALFFSPLAGLIPVYIAPEKRIGAFLLFASIIITFAWSSAASPSNVPSSCWLVYVFTDAAICIGAFLAVRWAR